MKNAAFSLQFPRFLILFSAGFFLSNAPAQAQQRQLLDRVVAVVNDRAITQSELDVFLRPLFDEMKKEATKEEDLVRQLGEIRLKLLNQMIEDELVLQEAKAKGVKVDDSEIDEQVEQFKSKFPSKDEFEKALTSEGFTLTELQERYRRQLLIQRLQDIEIRSKVVVSPLEIEEFYREHKAEFAEEEKLTVRSITVRKDEDTIKKGLTDEAAKRKIKRAGERIRAGESFEKIAQEISEDNHAKQGGLIGTVKHGEMMPVIDQALFKMPAGGISSVIETSVGYHLFKVESRTVSQIPSLEQIRDTIRIKIFQKKAQQRFKDWMEELKRKAYISIR